jgi:hypothetical protein
MESNNDEIMCGICYQSFDELQPSYTANCSQSKHLYHSKCLKCWYNRLLELPNVYDDKDKSKIINKPACPLCSDNKNMFVEKKFWSMLRIFQFEETIKKESETCTYRLNTILLEEGGELLSNPQLFERVRKDKSLLYGYKIVEYKCNPSQDSYVYYTGPKMFRKCDSFIFKEKSFEDTYINDTGDFAISATINNITEHPSNRDMYVLISPTIIGKTLSYLKIIFKVIFIIVTILCYYY